MAQPSPGTGSTWAEIPLPTETIESVRTDVATVKERVQR
jgi:hypothetical protein